MTTKVFGDQTSGLARGLLWMRDDQMGPFDSFIPPTPSPPSWPLLLILMPFYFISFLLISLLFFILIPAPTYAYINSFLPIHILNCSTSFITQLNILESQEYLRYMMEAYHAKPFFSLFFCVFMDSMQI